MVWFCFFKKARARAACWSASVARGDAPYSIRGTSDFILYFSGKRVAKTIFTM